MIAVFAFACFAFLPQAQAITPPPDGGYPGGNTAEGQNALLNLTTGTYSTAVGFLALSSDSVGAFNTAVGAGALLGNTGDPSLPGGLGNTATGAGTLLSNTIGSGNTGNGEFALFNNTVSDGNTATGASALFSNVGSALLGAGYNTAIGNRALYNNTTGSFNIALGANAGENVTTAINAICIGAAGNNVDNSCYIGNIFGATSSGGVAVFVNSNGRLGTMTSSARFKDEIKPIDKASEAILALRPMSFRYKKEIDPQGIPQFGLVAEDVEKVNPDLIIRDAQGRAQTVRYEQINAMLLNEFLKEHKTVQELKSTVQRQQAIIAQQQKSFESKLANQEKLIEALASGLQRVSTQCQLSTRAPQVADLSGVALRKGGNNP